ncbi:hypothetical protein U9M48_012139, partial [Paspalum notatum var. saurae]
MLNLQASTMDSGSNRKGKRKAIGYGRDLKSHFSQGSSSTPSTHGSGVGVEALKREEVVQTQIESTDAVAVLMPVEEVEGLKGRAAIVPMPVEEVEGRAGGGANSSREQTQDEDANDQGKCKTEDAKAKYETRLDTSLGIVSYIALQGEPFRGHDESEDSLNKGNFLEFLDWYKLRDEKVRRAYEGCPKNAKMTSGIIQKEMATCCAEAVTKVIKEEMDGCLFSILVDESCDISVKEQIAIVETTSKALKMAMVKVFSAHGLTIAQLRGQGYDGASNMRGEFNGVQKLIRDENPYAFYIYCFAHQLQLVVVSVSRCCSSMEDFFDYVNMIVTSTSASCKRKDLLLDSHCTNLLDKLESGQISSGRGQHQETSLARPRDTRWGSHYKTLLCIETIWDSIILVLSVIRDDQRNPSRAGGLVYTMESFSFVFIMKMILQIFRITSELSSLLQKKDQNIVEAMSLVIDVKTCLVNLRSEGYEPLLDEVKAFCYENDIPIPNMKDN